MRGRNKSSEIQRNFLYYGYVKVERLISILMLLLDRRKLTARELAEYFEVSVRTIQRDMDTLSSAGIPVYGDVGQAGGYHLTENYRLDRSFLTTGEMDTLEVMLTGFRDTLFTDSIKTILEKLNVVNRKSQGTSSYRIDMTPWGSDDSFRQSIGIIECAIESKSLISFEYYDLYNRKTVRTVEPYTILCKSGSWYLYAFCLLRGEYRLFKIGRMYQLQNEDSHYSPRCDGDPSALQPIDRTREAERITVRFAPEMRGRIPDFFDPRNAVLESTGSLLFTVLFPVDEWLIAVLLGFGDGGEVLEPLWLREEMAERIKKMTNLYQL